MIIIKFKDVFALYEKDNDRLQDYPLINIKDLKGKTVCTSFIKYKDLIKLFKCDVMTISTSSPAVITLNCLFDELNIEGAK